MIVGFLFRHLQAACRLDQVAVNPDLYRTRRVSLPHAADQQAHVSGGKYPVLRVVFDRAGGERQGLGLHRSGAAEQQRESLAFRLSGRQAVEGLPKGAEVQRRVRLFAKGRQQSRPGGRFARVARQASELPGRLEGVLPALFENRLVHPLCDRPGRRLILHGFFCPRPQVAGRCRIACFRTEPEQQGAGGHALGALLRIGRQERLAFLFQIPPGRGAAVKLEEGPPERAGGGIRTAGRCAEPGEGVFLRRRQVKAAERIACEEKKPRAVAGPRVERLARGQARRLGDPLAVAGYLREVLQDPGLQAAECGIVGREVCCRRQARVPFAGGEQVRHAVGICLRGRLAAGEMTAQPLAPRLLFSGCEAWLVHQAVAPCARGLRPG